ncbi:MAG: iron-sulfur cluster assembly accessory protein [Myxococcota bacterium]|nr:iron-sulfur cluster assembly accessory protein [Myxococcota bacterium]MDW8361484.1 iron-sulfur cluster assembly accessory protein [Myxococcales bacterium]
MTGAATEPIAGSEAVPTGEAALAPQQPPVRLTPKAIEMARKALERRGTPQAAIRLGIRGGGCSGVSYAMEFADTVRPRDHVFDFDGVRVVIDPKSLVYLRGTVLDYETKLMEHGFRFRNPNEKNRCGCGNSFGI